MNAILRGKSLRKMAFIMFTLRDLLDRSTYSSARQSNMYKKHYKITILLYPLKLVEYVGATFRDICLIFYLVCATFTCVCATFYYVRSTIHIFPYESSPNKNAKYTTQSVLGVYQAIIIQN